MSSDYGRRVTNLLYPQPDVGMPVQSMMQGVLADSHKSKPSVMHIFIVTLVLSFGVGFGISYLVHRKKGDKPTQQQE